MLGYTHKDLNSQADNNIPKINFFSYFSFIPNFVCASILPSLSLSISLSIYIYIYIYILWLLDDFEYIGFSL